MTKLVAEFALLQRAEVRKLNDSLQTELKNKGMNFNEVQVDPFRAKLRASGFYADWHKKFGDEAWSLLEKYTGKLS